MIRILALLILLACPAWQPPAAAVPGSGAYPGRSTLSDWYECVQPRASDHEKAAVGLTLCTAQRVREGRPEGITLPERAVLVTAVAPESAAAREGLVAGDAIYRVRGQPVASAEEATSRLEEPVPGETHVNFLRDGRPFLVRLSD